MNYVGIPDLFAGDLESKGKTWKTGQKTIRRRMPCFADTRYRRSGAEGTGSTSRVKLEDKDETECQLVSRLRRHRSVFIVIWIDIVSMVFARSRSLASCPGGILSSEVFQLGISFKITHEIYKTLQMAKKGFRIPSNSTSGFF